LSLGRMSTSGVTAILPAFMSEGNRLSAGIRTGPLVELPETPGVPSEDPPTIRRTRDSSHLLWINADDARRQDHTCCHAADRIGRTVTRCQGGGQAGIRSANP